MKQEKTKDNRGKGTILMLEDDISLILTSTEVYRKYGYTVIPCVNIYEANDAWMENKNEIDILLVDSNMDGKGLTVLEQGKSNGGMFSGWIWLNNYVYCEDGETTRPEIDKLVKKTFIVSAYIPQIESNLIRMNKCIKHGVLVYKKLSDRNRLISKENNLLAYRKLIDRFKEVYE